MTCRHSPGDPECTSGKSPEDMRKAANRYSMWGDSTSAYDRPSTPDCERFEVIDAIAIDTHLVMKVKYPNCSSCEYEGHKVMVFRNTTALDALRWKRIDPHFRNPKKSILPREAPSPAARFPASNEGWQDAIDYATKLPNSR